ncbi:MAG: NRDE family protein [bacterium]|nr:NRDE family protein [bacterium]
MCTVTFVPTSDGFYFTSSRDERVSRRTIPPVRYSENGRSLIYPKDEKAGGTWIASDSKGKTACLLNGAFVNHKKEYNYVKSRGLILLESFEYKDISEFSDKTNLDGVEPFTLLILDYSNGALQYFNEFRWDGQNKYLKSLSQVDTQIWSSATLYSKPIQDIRLSLFENWIKKHEQFEDKMILDFHNRKHGLDSTNDILMQGYKDLRTLSISQIHLKNDNAFFKYVDLIRNKTSLIKLDQTEYANAF